MTATTPQRPPMLTATCLYLGVFAVIQTITVIDLISTWNGENGSERVQWAIDRLRDGGMSVAEADSFYKGFLTVLAAMAATGIVFAIFTARGDRASRWGLTIVMAVVGLCFFAGATGGGFLDVLLGALSMAFATRLWRGEAKAWFRVLAGHEPPTPQRPSEAPRPFVGAAAQHPGSIDGPAVEEPTAAVEPAAPVAPVPPSYQAPAGRREPLPKPVSIATWTTLVASLVVAGFSALAVAVLGLVGDDFEQFMRDSPFGDSLVDSGTDLDSFRRTTLAIYGMSLVLSLGGIAAAAWVLAKRRSGDVFLFVMAVVTIATSFLAFPLGLPFAAAAIVVIVQLRKPESRRWFVKT